MQNSNNALAGQKYIKDKESFRVEAMASVLESEKRLFLVHQNSTLRFAVAKPEHETILSKALEIDKENVHYMYLHIDHAKRQDKYVA